MGRKNKKHREGVVYSTSSDFEYDVDDEQAETLPPGEQRLKVRMEKKGRKGKTAVVVDDFVGSDQDLKDLAKELKSACGTGGSAKDRQIIIQGDMRSKIVELLKEKGYSNTKQAGG